MNDDQQPTPPSPDDELTALGLTLDPWQRLVLRQALEQDANGDWVVHELRLSRPAGRSIHSRDVPHDVITFGPVREGEKTISGGTYPMDGYGWSCSCHAAGFGYASEDEADDWATKHADQVP